ncbi:MAG: hypothetical protein OXE53_04725 [Deltaproteobacteria bacterium]|nr:hypothetical protein [Deltaproteobacteria bacterium]
MAALFPRILPSRSSPATAPIIANTYVGVRRSLHELSCDNARHATLDGTIIVVAVKTGMLAMHRIGEAP